MKKDVANLDNDWRLTGDREILKWRYVVWSKSSFSGTVRLRPYGFTAIAGLGTKP